MSPDRLTRPDGLTYHQGVSPTHRLDHHDSLLRSFSARVLAVETSGRAPALVLDQTAFFPEGGGQLADRGVLRLAAGAGADATTWAVVDVQVDAAGVVRHLIDPGAVAGAALPSPGAAVSGELDWARRRQHMAQHTAQHLLSRLLLDRAEAATVSARLGERVCTVDLGRERVDEARLAAAEDEANAVIDADLPVRAWFPTPTELAALPLRKEPSVEHQVRVVAIGELDVSPCGGSHCTTTAQIGLVRIIGAERYKGMTRVSFVTGARARHELFGRDRELRASAGLLGAGVDAVASGVERLRRQLGEAEAATLALRAALAEQLVGALVLAQPGGADRPVLAPLRADLELAREVAAGLGRRGRDAVLLVTRPDGDDDGVALLVHRGDGGRLDAGRLVKQVTAAAGGRGGGRPEHAEGRIPASAGGGPDLQALVRAALAALPTAG